MCKGDCHPLSRRADGYLKVFDFEGGYQASVISTRHGDFEILVLLNDKHCPIGGLTDDYGLINHLSFDGVAKALERIRSHSERHAEYSQRAAAAAAAAKEIMRLRGENEKLKQRLRLADAALRSQEG